MSENVDFVPLLLDWFAQNRRDLPWRRTYDPYGVWVSEIMAQQTQLDRVAVYFERFTARFRSVAARAGADETEVLKAWEGLGYYSRARNLLAAARRVMAEHGGRLPADFVIVHMRPHVTRGIRSRGCHSVPALPPVLRTPAAEGRTPRRRARRGCA